MILSRRTLALLLAATIPLLLLWPWRAAMLALLSVDVLVLAAAFIDYYRTRNTSTLTISRVLPRRFMLGIDNPVTLKVANRGRRTVALLMKDEFPPELHLRGARQLGVRLTSRSQTSLEYALFAENRGDYHFGDVIVRMTGPWGLAVRQIRVPASVVIKVYPNTRDARHHELAARRNQQLITGLRRSRIRGQGKEFESMRDYVAGDELRTVSWTSTARRGRLTTKQFQVERNQNVVVMIDAGRLMTSRISNLSKLDYAINATLSIAHVATNGGDNIGLLVFARQVLKYIPPRRGTSHLHALIEGLYSVKAQMIEPSYARAFETFSRNCKRRSLVVILTDIIDADSSAELLSYTATLLPRHLPLIVTIGDRDLSALVARAPEKIQDVYEQSVAEELLRQRAEALARIAELGGLALDITAGQLSIALVNRYLDVKARGLL